MTKYKMDTSTAASECGFAHVSLWRGTTIRSVFIGTAVIDVSSWQRMICEFRRLARDRGANYICLGVVDVKIKVDM